MGVGAGVGAGVGKRAILRPAVKLHALRSQGAQMRSARKKQSPRVLQCLPGIDVLSLNANELQLVLAAHNASHPFHVLGGAPEPAHFHTVRSFRWLPHTVFMFTTSNCSELGVWPSNVCAASSAGESARTAYKPKESKTATRKSRMQLRGSYFDCDSVGSITIIRPSKRGEPV